MVESGERPEGGGQVVEVVTGRRLAEKPAESFPFSESVELGRDDGGGTLVGELRNWA